MKTDKELIAEFMGYEIGVIDYYGSKEETEWQRKHRKWIDSVDISSVGTYAVKFKENEWVDFDDLNYRDSWDDLMPVVEKINDGLGTINIDSDSVFIHSENELLDHIYNYQHDRGKIGAVYAAVIFFIKWYNTQPKETTSQQQAQSE